MADLVIRGMEMPKDGRITIQIGTDGAVYFVENCRIMAEKYEKNSHVISLPEGHGKLGDLDTLEAKLREEALRHTYIGDLNRMTLDVSEVIDKIRMTETLVPAEGGCENG